MLGDGGQLGVVRLGVAGADDVAVPVQRCHRSRPDADARHQREVAAGRLARHDQLVAEPAARPVTGFGDVVDDAGEGRLRREPVVDRDHGAAGIEIACQELAVRENDIAAVAGDEGAAVDPHHDRAGFRGSVHVSMERTTPYPEAVQRKRAT